MKTNKYLFFNNYNQLDYWFIKVREYLTGRRLLWRYDSLHRVIDFEGQKWMFVRNER